jgi:hypothetical protein
LAAAEVAELVASAIISPHNFKMTGKPPPGAHAGAFKKQEDQTGLSGTAN